MFTCHESHKNLFVDFKIFGQRLRLRAIKYFREIAPSKILGMVLNMPLKKEMFVKNSGTFGMGCFGEAVNYFAKRLILDL